MKNNLNLFLILLTLLITVTGCQRNEYSDETSSSYSEITTDFRVASRESTVDYQRFMRDNYYIYYLDNPKDAPDFKNENLPYIEFKYASQVFYAEDSSKFVVFPLVLNSVVEDVIIGKLDRNDSFIEYYFPEKNTFVEKAISQFSAKFVPNGDGTYSGDNSNILEVVIPAPPKPTAPTPRTLFIDTIDFHLPPGTTTGGGGGGGSTNTLVPPPPPNVPIADISEFLSCLNIHQSANVTIYSQKVFSSFPGHAFISIQQGSVRKTYGFYPKNSGLSQYTGAGTFANDANHLYTHYKNFNNITALQLQQIIAASIAFQNSDYQLLLNNCADFATFVSMIVGD